MTDRNDVHNAGRAFVKEVLDYVDQHDDQVRRDLRKELNDNAKTLRGLSEMFGTYMKDNPPRSQAEADKANEMRVALSDAVNQHKVVSTAAKNGEEVPLDQVDEAMAATATAKLSWDEWRQDVDTKLHVQGQAIEKHGRDIEALKRDKADKVNIQPTRVIATPTEPVAKTVLEPEPKHQGIEVFEDTTPKAASMPLARTAPAPAGAVSSSASSNGAPTCKWGTLAWICACIGALVFFIFALSVPSEFGQPAPVWLRDLVLFVFGTALGFFLGGTIGSIIEQRQASGNAARAEARA